MGKFIKITTDKGENKIINTDYIFRVENNRGVTRICIASAGYNNFAFQYEDVKESYEDVCSMLMDSQ